MLQELKCVAGTIRGEDVRTGAASFRYLCAVVFMETRGFCRASDCLQSYLELIPRQNNADNAEQRCDNVNDAHVGRPQLLISNTCARRCHVALRDKPRSVTAASESVCENFVYQK